MRKGKGTEQITITEETYIEGADVTLEPGDVIEVASGDGVRPLYEFTEEELRDIWKDAGNILAIFRKETRDFIAAYLDEVEDPKRTPYNAKLFSRELGSILVAIMWDEVKFVARSRDIITKEVLESMIDRLEDF